MNTAVNKSSLLKLLIIPILSMICYQYYQNNGLFLLNQHIEHDINSYMSSKSNYINSSLLLRNDEDIKYELVGFEGIFRHGTRHLNSEKKVLKATSYFNKLYKQNYLNDLSILNYTQQFEENELNYTGSICDSGRQEIYGISQRLLDRWNNTLLNYPIHTTNTYKVRTQETQDAFLRIFKDRNSSVLIMNEDGKKCKNIENDLDMYSYATTRYYDVCPTYLDYKASLSDSTIIDDYFNTEYLQYYTLPMSQSYLNMNAIKSDFNQLNHTENPITYNQYVQSIVWKTMNKIYTLCQIESSCHKQKYHMCTYLNQVIKKQLPTDRYPVKVPLLSLLNQYDNVKQYFKKGPSNHATYDMSCVLMNHIVENTIHYVLKDIINKHLSDDMYNHYKSLLSLYGFKENNTQFNYNIDLHFAHAETLFAFYSLFNITPSAAPSLLSSVNYDLSAIIPMSANIQFEIIYCETCDSLYNIRIYINEKLYSIPFRECIDQNVCSIDTFLLYYTYLYEKNHITKCDLEGFKQLCHGLACSKE